jgi:hypothetical protein
MFSRTAILGSLAAVSVVLIGLACEDVANKGLFLQGRWTIVNAQRNGHPTQMLNGAYFIFDPTAHQLRTNLRLDEQEGEISVPYQFSEAAIEQKTESPVKYAIKSHTDSTLVLEFETRGFPFEIELKKGEAIQE